MTKNEEERRAFELLQWVPFGLPAEFDDELAQAGYYSKIQRQRSDAALDAFDAAHPYETSSELAAFRELERLRIYSPHTLFSPLKAKDGFYTRRLKELRQPGSSERPQNPPARRPKRSYRRHL